MITDKSRKAQIVGQVFVYVAAGLVFVLILAYGYKAISKFTERSYQVEIIDFKTTLENAIEYARQDYGSVHKITLRVPSKHGEVCIVDSDYNKESEEFKNKKPLFHKLWKSGGENIFFVPKQPIQIYLPAISVTSSDNVHLCTEPKNNKVKLWVQGLGDRAVISLEPPASQ